MEDLELKCSKCGIGYTKPFKFKEWNENKSNVFFKWSLTYCDTCRREREREALQSLPSVIKKLSE